MSKNRKYIVDDETLENWMIENKDTVHKMSLETSRELIESKSDNETVKLMEFEWNNVIYARLYVHRDDLPDALTNAEKYFVREEMFEEACEARDLRPLLGNPSNV
jgi:hypothetical protein